MDEVDERIESLKAAVATLINRRTQLNKKDRSEDARIEIMQIRNNLTNARSNLRYYQKKKNDGKELSNRHRKDPHDEIIRLRKEMEELCRERDRLKNTSRSRRIDNLANSTHNVINPIPRVITLQISRLKTKIAYYQSRIEDR